VFERDCRYIKILAKQNSTEASFVLQPFAPYVEKSPSAQELKLFDLLDQEAEGFSRVLGELAELRRQYTQDLRSICEVVGLRFVDMNDAAELKGSDWLFVDRVHLTDEGYSRVANLLVRDLAL
ncbi:MAG: SGNH/GDSL hydrolase family protein, partial [Actinomycetota bacterium]